MMITLWWPHRPGTFYIIWDGNESLKWNLSMTWAQLRRWGPYHGVDGIGCVCGGYAQPKTRRWPYWLWSNYYWDQHVKICPVPRDEDGHVIK